MHNSKWQVITVLKTTVITAHTRAVTSNSAEDKMMFRTSIVPPLQPVRISLCHANECTNHNSKDCTTCGTARESENFGSYAQIQRCNKINALRWSVQGLFAIALCAVQPLLSVSQYSLVGALYLPFLFFFKFTNTFCQKVVWLKQMQVLLLYHFGNSVHLKENPNQWI